MRIESELPLKLKKAFEQRDGTSCRVFADLGSGIFPVAFVGSRQFQGNDFYVGVEADEKKIRQGLALTGNILKNKGNRERVGENIFFVKRRFGNLPFPDASVDEVFLGNILGESAIHFVDEVLEQSSRILKSGGTLIILEIITPSVAENRGLNRLNSFVVSFGFRKLREIRFGEPSFIREVSKYASHQVPHLGGGEFVTYFNKG